MTGSLGGGQSVRRILRRSCSVVPAQIPTRVAGCDNAHERHSCRTGHVWQTTMAGTGVSPPAGNQVTSGRSRQAARRCHSGKDCTGVEYPGRIGS
jgi:hypothetical protein